MEKTNSEEKWSHVKEWKKLWEVEENPPHYRDYVHKLLFSNFSKQVDGRQELRIFVPLCGKSIDLKWMSDQGHYVVGVEASELPVKAMFQNGGIDHSIEIDGQHKVYLSDDGRIKVYVSDIFQLSRSELGSFDVIWDRASFVALDREHISKYIALMKSLMTDGCRYLLAAVDMKVASGEKPKTGPPHVMHLEDIQAVFGNEYSVSFLENLDCTSLASPKWKIEWFHENLYLIHKT